MNDIIDINTGTIIEGEETIEQAGTRILEYVIGVASGEIDVSAVRHNQDDFIPWKRGVSLQPQVSDTFAAFLHMQGFEVSDTYAQAVKLAKFKDKVKV